MCGFLRLSVSGAELLDQEIEWGAKMRRLPQQQEESKTTLAFPQQVSVPQVGLVENKTVPGKPKLGNCNDLCWTQVLIDGN